MNKIIVCVFLVFSVFAWSQEDSIQKQDNIIKEIKAKDTTILRLEKKLKEIKIDTARAGILFNIGSRLFGKDNTRAKKLLNEAVELLPEASYNNSLRGKIYQYLAAINNDQGNYPKAMAQFIKSKQEFEIVNDSLRIANLFYNMAILHNFQGDFELAKKKLHKAIHINTIYKDTLSLAHNYSTLGEHYGMVEKPDSAMLFFNKSKVLFTALNDQNGLNNLKSHLAKFYLGIGDYKKSIILFKECVDFGIKNDFIVYQIIYTNKLAWAYKEAKEYKNALKYNNQSLDLALRDDHKQWIVNGYLQKSEIEEALGNYKEAYKSARLHKQFSDSIFNKKNVKKIQELELTYQFRKEKVKDSMQLVKQKEIAETKAQLLKSESKIKSQWMLFGGIGLLALFSMVYLTRSRKFAVSKQELQEQFTQDILNEQENERSRLARELHDSVGQKLMLLSKTSKNLGSSEAENLASSTLEEIRSISRGLHPSNLERLGLTEAINALVYDINANTDLFFTDDIDNIDNILSKESELHLYRIVQESLSNIVKHSEAKAVKMKIQKTANDIQVMISDNGKGFDLESQYKNMSLGLKTLFERAKILGAKMNLDSVVNQGTKVTLTITH
ncbi:sensor histidine kinase [uncultured Lacinutrix sp.]|uniref:tetratricopeptide repeat-containing sensor histidine kinase n=1 Tax=uncultured Lacinutrix sp. TaxID=574032 RepID=UPI00263554E0|nr:sensor histidine kinase [uncultured Lacinutrix sp.]